MSFRGSPGIEHKSFDGKSLSLTCGILTAWKGTKHYCTPEGLVIGFTFSGKFSKSLIVFLDKVVVCFVFLCQQQMPSGSPAQEAFHWFP